jgi:hypothetical protein
MSALGLMFLLPDPELPLLVKGIWKAALYVIWGSVAAGIVWRWNASGESSARYIYRAAILFGAASFILPVFLFFNDRWWAAGKNLSIIMPFIFVILVTTGLMAAQALLQQIVPEGSAGARSPPSLRAAAGMALRTGVIILVVGHLTLGFYRPIALAWSSDGKLYESYGYPNGENTGSLREVYVWPVSEWDEFLTGCSATRVEIDNPWMDRLVQAFLVDSERGWFSSLPIQTNYRGRTAGMQEQPPDYDCVIAESWADAPADRRVLILKKPTEYDVYWTVTADAMPMTAMATEKRLVTFRNTGTMAWPATGANSVTFRYRWSAGGCTAAGPVVVSFGNATPLPQDVAPGDVVRDLEVSIEAPPDPGRYCLAYDLHHSGVTWFSVRGAPLMRTAITVNAPTPTATDLTEYGVDWTVAGEAMPMSAKATQKRLVTFRNTGTMAWPATGTNPVTFRYRWSAGECTANGPVVVPFGNATPLPQDVAPGDVVRNLEVSIEAPPDPGRYCLTYDLHHTGVTWFSVRGASLVMTAVTVTASPQP